MKLRAGCSRFPWVHGPGLACMFLSLLLSCAPARFVKPLADNEQALDVSAGGPFFVYGTTTLPMPLISATYGYGIDSSFTAFGGINLTSALYGNFQTDFGVVKQVVTQRGWLPGVSVTPAVNIIYRNRDAVKIFPQLDVYAYREYGKRRNMVYAGICNWFELAKKRSLEQDQPNHWLFTPVIGHKYAGRKWMITAEAKVIAPNLSNDKLVIEYKTPFGNLGAFGIYLGYTRKF